MVQRKGQIGLAATEVNYFQGLIFGKIWEYVLYDLQIAIYLAKLAVVSVYNPAVLLHNAKPDEKIAGRSVWNSIFFGTVVLQCRNASRCRSGSDSRLCWF